MNQKKRLKIAKEWFSRGTRIENTDCFEQFIYLWIAFNTLYGQLDCGDRQGVESYACKCYAEGIGSIEKYDLLLESSDAMYFADRPIKNTSTYKNYEYYIEDTKPNADVLRDKRNPPDQRLANLMLCIYMARCNLFHGRKIPNDNGYIIVNHAVAVLKEYLKICLDGQKNED